MSGISQVVLRRVNIHHSATHFSRRTDRLAGGSACAFHASQWNVRSTRYASSSHYSNLQTWHHHVLVRREFLYPDLRVISCQHPWSQGFHWTRPLFDEKPSSKLESAVNALKEEGAKASAQQTSTSGATDVSGGKVEKGVSTAPAPQAVVKLSIWERIKHELLHYYHGFRLLFLNVRVCKKYVKKVLRGETLSRRENQQLVRTVSDMFRLVPFSVFIIVPFMELLLPVALWLFPNMLPSTFESQNQKEEKLKKTFRVKLKMAKFLQVTLDEMAAEAKRSSHESSDKAKELVQFFQSVREGGGKVDPDKIIQFSKFFEDELTLDSLGRQQLVALCRILELQPIGTQAFLRWQLRMRLRSLKADDKLILKEGVDSLTVWELQQACKARGMKAFGVSENRMRQTLNEWLALSLNEKVPTSLLLLSRALYIPEELSPEVKLEATISQLPESVARKAKVRVDEQEGKLSYKDQYDIVKEEEAIIEQEREERRQEELKLMEQAAKKIHMPVAESILGEGAKAVARMSAITGESTGAIAERMAEAKVLQDRAPTLEAKPSESLPPELDMQDIADLPAKPAPGAATATPAVTTPQAVKAVEPGEQVVSREVLEHLEDAIEHLQTEKQKAVQSEREKLEAIKQEIEEYSEDVKNLEEIAKSTEVKVRESRAAKILHKKVESMIKKMDNVVAQLEKGKTELESQIDEGGVSENRQRDLVRVDDLLSAISALQKLPDDTLNKRIIEVIQLFDEDKDGSVDVKLVVRVLELLGKENVKLNDRMVAELVDLIEKEEILDEIGGKRSVSPAPAVKNLPPMEGDTVQTPTERISAKPSEKGDGDAKQPPIPPPSAAIPPVLPPETKSQPRPKL